VIGYVGVTRHGRFLFPRFVLLAREGPFFHGMAVDCCLSAHEKITSISGVLPLTVQKAAWAHTLNL
jgi:hypothetical protein